MASLHYATRTGDLGAVIALINSEARVDDVSEKLGETALHIAAHEGFLEIVHALLKAGANPNAANKFGDCPIHHAAAEGFLFVVQALVEAGADVDPISRRWPPALKAAVANRPSTVAYLVERGANPDFGNEHGSISKLLEVGGIQGLFQVPPAIFEAMEKSRNAQSALQAERHSRMTAEEIQREEAREERFFAKTSERNAKRSPRA